MKRDPSTNPGWPTKKGDNTESIVMDTIIEPVKNFFDKAAEGGKQFYDSVGEKGKAIYD